MLKNFLFYFGLFFVSLSLYHKTLFRLFMSAEFENLSKEFAQALHNMIETNKSANQIKDFIYTQMSKAQAKELGFSRKELLLHAIACKKSPQPNAVEIEKKQNSSEDSTKGSETNSTPKDNRLPAPEGTTGSTSTHVTVHSDSSEESSLLSR